jgi:DNA (cytosine-5)-methyltransferase 3A
MNVLSLFDGMSCGMIALDRLGIKVDNYYASEIDKYAIQVSQANYPNIIQVGDITKLDLSTLPKIDLVMGGSPCQGFSFAGKQLAFDDPRSALFFEFVKCVDTLKPKYFLLENVRMKKEYLDIISEYMGVEPIFINSSLVSAQSRQRYYWTNIPGIEQPEERGIVLRDILEDYPSQNPVKQTERNARHLKQLDDKSLCMTATMYKGAGNNGMTLVPQKLVDDISDLPKKSSVIKANYYKSSKANFENDTTKGGKFSATGIPQKLVDDTSDLPEKSQTIKSQYYKSSKANFERSGTFHATGIPQKLVSDKPQHIGTAVDVKAAAYRARSVDENGKRVAWKDTKPKQMLELLKDEKSNSVTSVQKDNVLTQNEVYWRKLTPLECERLQTVPDNYTNHVSNTQRYKMLGNGWTIEVIAHILQNMEIV